MSSRGITVFGIAETWLRPSISDGELAIDHYNLLRKDRLHRHGGGVCVYYHESLGVQCRTDLESDDLEILWLDVCGSSSCFVLVVVTGLRICLKPNGITLNLTWRELASGLMPILF